MAREASDGYFALKGCAVGIIYAYQLATTIYSGNTVEKLAKLMDDAKIQNKNLMDQAVANRAYMDGLVHQANTCATSLAQLMEKIDTAQLTVAGGLIPPARAATRAQTPSIQSEARPDVQIAQNIEFVPGAVYLKIL